MSVRPQKSKAGSDIPEPPEEEFLAIQAKLEAGRKKQKRRS